MILHPTHLHPSYGLQVSLTCIHRNVHTQTHTDTQTLKQKTNIIIQVSIQSILILKVNVKMAFTWHIHYKEHHSGRAEQPKSQQQQRKKIVF